MFAGVQAAAEEEPKPFLYDLELSLTDENGKTSGLDVFRGSPVIVSLFYASCPSACPRLINDILRVTKAMDDATRAKVKVLLVSLDPKNDSVSKLSAAAKRHKLDTGQWKLARTSAEKVRELAAILDVKYRFLPKGGIEHSSVLVLIGPNGEIDARFEGLGQPAEPIAARLKALAL
jgi:protein SCO1/2